MDTFQFWTITIESVITIIAIVIAGIFAWRNGIIFRHRSPHINIAHDVTHRFISPSYTHLIVTATLHNSSRVKVEFRDGFVVLQKIAPLDDDELTQLYAQSFDDAVSANADAEDIQWETLDEIRGVWNKDELIVEPGSVATLTIEFIVPKDIQAVLITTYLYNTRVMGKIDNAFTDIDDAPKRKHWLLRWREIEGTRGWTRTSAYDIFHIDD